MSERDLIEALFQKLMQLILFLNWVPI